MIQKTQEKNYYPGLVAFYDTWPGNEVGLFYNAPGVTRGIELNSFIHIKNVTVKSFI